MTPRKTDLQLHGLRRVIADAIAIKNGGDPHEIATQRWGAGRPPFVDVLEQRAGVVGMTSADDSPFASESQAFFESVSADSVVAAMELRRVPFHARLVSVVSGATGSWTAESLGKPISQMSLSAAGLEPRKVASLYVVSDELLRDTGGEQVIQSDMRRAVSDSLDLAFLSASAATASTPAGILSGVSAVTGGADVQGSIAALVADFDGDTRRAVWIARPNVYAAISQTYARVGIGGSNNFLLGIPALVSPFAVADRLYLVDASRVAFAGGVIEVKASKNVNVQMDTAPTKSAATPTATTSVSMFQSNCTALKCEAWCNWSAASGAVSTLTTTAWQGIT
jgi:hypothetical protein